MGSGITTNVLEKVDKWLFQGLPLEHMNFTPEQKYRCRVVYEAYQLWLQNKQIKPTDVLRRISQREYAILLQKAQDGNKDAEDLCRRMKITPERRRSVSEISFDVQMLNHIIATFNTDTSAIDKAKVLDSADFLMSEGKKTMDFGAVYKGADVMMRLYDDFKEKDNVADRMANTDLSITEDVSIIKSNRVNITDEEKHKLAKRFGLDVKDVVDMMENDDGVYIDPEDEEPERDVFDYQQNEGI